MDLILAFVWGMITVVYTLMALVVVQMRKSVKELESQIGETNQTISNIYKTIDERENKAVSYSDTLHNNLYDEMNKMYGYIDSRFDKMESKLKAEVSSGTEVRKIIEDNQLTKQRLDEFIRTYQNQ